MPASLTPGQDLVLTDKQGALLQNILTHDLPLTVVETIRPLGLGVALPQPGARKIIDIPNDKAPYAQIKTVAIVSAIGDQIEFDHVGAMFGAGRSSDRPLPAPADWQLDEKVEAEIKDAVSRRFTIKDTGQGRAALYAAPPIDTSVPLRKTLDQLAPRADIDGYIVVLKYTRPIDDITATGLGLANRGTLGKSFSFMFAQYAILLVDAHSLKVLAVGFAQMSPKFPSTQPVLLESDYLWPDQPSAARPPQLALIHTDLDKMLDDGIPETLLWMRLTGKAVARELPSATDASQ